MQLDDLILNYKADAIILARYMQILSKEISEKYSGKIINIHHSFLPSFYGELHLISRHIIEV